MKCGRLPATSPTDLSFGSCDNDGNGVNVPYDSANEERTRATGLMSLEYLPFLCSKPLPGDPHEHAAASPALRHLLCIQPKGSWLTTLPCAPVSLPCTMTTILLHFSESGNFSLYTWVKAVLGACLGRFLFKHHWVAMSWERKQPGSKAGWMPCLEWAGRGLLKTGISVFKPHLPGAPQYPRTMRE